MSLWVWRKLSTTEKLTKTRTKNKMNKKTHGVWGGQKFTEEGG
jgi:hypothetical protein